jgi:hypothetical protein
LLTQIKEWRARFETGDFLCKDQSRPDRPPRVSEKALSDFLEEFPFATAGIITQHFGKSKSTIKEILQQEFGRRKFSRMWVSYSFSDAQKADWTAMAIDLSSILYHQENYSFSQIMTGDESWFLCLYPSDHMFAVSRDEVIPREHATIGPRKLC